MSVRELTERMWVIVARMMPFTTAVPEAWLLLRDLTKDRSILEEKIARATSALQETSGLLSELESGVRERAETLERLRKEYEQYSRLAAVEEEKAKALIQQIELTVGKGKGAERLISLALNVLAGMVVFILGVYFGPQVTTWLGMNGK